MDIDPARFPLTLVAVRCLAAAVAYEVICVAGFRALASGLSACWDVGSFASPFWLFCWPWLVCHLFMSQGCGDDMIWVEFLQDFFFGSCPSLRGRARHWSGQRESVHCPHLSLIFVVTHACFAPGSRSTCVHSATRPERHDFQAVTTPSWVWPGRSVNGHYVLPMGGQLMCPLVASKTAR